MADDLGIMLSELPEAHEMTDNDIMYIVQGDDSEKVKVGTLINSILGETYGEGTGNIVSFPDGASADLVDCIVEIEPKQEGSGTPSPSNVRAISGVSTVKTDVAGKNLFDVSTPSVLNAAMDSQGEWSASNYYNGYIFKGGFIYTLSMVKGSGFDSLRYAIRTNGSGARQTSNMNEALVIDARNADEVRIVLGKNDFATNVQLEIGSTATTYEPYIGATYTTALGQTVYGGRLNVLTGELTVDRGYVDLGSLTWTVVNGQTSEYNYFQSSTLVDSKATAYCICSSYAYSSGISTTLGGDKEVRIDGNKGVRVRDLSYNDSATFKTAMSGVPLVYELATPQTYQLTPQEVKSLLGQNHISADAGDIAITYVKESARIIPNPSGEPDAVLSSIELSGKKFEIIKELPAFPSSNGNYKLSLSISSGVPTLSWVSDT